MGAEVPTDNYKLTGQAIQEAATGLRLHVVIPSVFAELCIGYCPSESACGSLVSRVAAAVAKSTFSGTNPQEDTFVAGHSLGATCANFMVTYQQFQYAGLMEFGGYVDMNGTSSLPNYGVPLLHMAGELDGGAARPGKLACFYGRSKTWGEALAPQCTHCFGDAVNSLKQQMIVLAGATIVVSQQWDMLENSLTQ